MVDKSTKVLRSFLWGLNIWLVNHLSLTNMVNHFPDLLRVKMPFLVDQNTTNITVTKRDKCTSRANGSYKTWTQKVVFKETCRYAKQKL